MQEDSELEAMTNQKKLRQKKNAIPSKYTGFHEEKKLDTAHLDADIPTIVRESQAQKMS